MEDQERIAELEEQVETLKARLKKVNGRLAAYQRAESRRFQYESDYVPYEDRYE